MREPQDTHFLNVDLDIYSKRDLSLLIAKLGRKMFVLYAGKERGRFSAHLEIAKHATTADSTIYAFCRAIKNLPQPARDIWDAASVRSFSIGVQAMAGSPVRDFRVKNRTLTEVIDVGAEIVLTVYPPDLASNGKNDRPSATAPGRKSKPKSQRESR